MILINDRLSFKKTTMDFLYTGTHAKMRYAVIFIHFSMKALRNMSIAIPRLMYKTKTPIKLC